MTEKTGSKKIDAAGQTEKQLTELRKSLVYKRHEVLTQLTRGTRDLSAIEGRESELMDRAEAVVELDDRAQQSARNSALLDEIDAALQKLDEGSYGNSEESGEPIGYARLSAIPWARRTAREEEAFGRRR